MDSCNWTPNKKNCDSIMMLSPITKTPIRQNSIKLKNSLQNCTNNFSVLPNHITPPSGLTKFIARNPFEADLTSKLHISIMSPTVFSKTSNSSQKDSTFAWSVDELALLHPAKIDEFPNQQMHCSDPEIEKTAQEAIHKFFSENQIIPSPYDAKRNESEKLSQIPTRNHEEMNSSNESCKLKKEKKDNWAQTVLSLPPELPPHVEEILKPYFNFTQEQNCETEEANSSNSSLRRKLFANHNESQDDLNDSPKTPTKQKNSSFELDLSPPQSGMFFHGTPLRNSQINQRTYGTPRSRSRSSSPCDVSPISHPGFNMSCQSIVSRNRSGVRLDFTKDMSVEEEDKDVRKNLCETLFPEENKKFKMTSSEHFTDESDHCDVTQMVVSSENFVQYKCEDKENVIPNTFDAIDKSKVNKINFSESYAMQQSKMISGNHMQQMVFSSTHDTGYQTYSSSNLTNNTDNCSISIKQKLHWDERIVQTDDEVQLQDWENMKSMISSTPSKLQKGISNF